MIFRFTSEDEIQEKNPKKKKKKKIQKKKKKTTFFLKKIRKKKSEKKLFLLKWKLEKHLFYRRPKRRVSTPGNVLRKTLPKQAELTTAMLVFAQKRWYLLYNWLRGMIAAEL
jgi:hypothetical protein